MRSTLEIQKRLPHGFIGICDYVPAAMAAVHSASRWLNECFMDTVAVEGGGTK